MYLFVETQFNEVYNMFLIENFNIDKIDLLPTIQYCSTFLDTKFSYQLPPAAKLIHCENPEVYYLNKLNRIIMKNF